MTYQVDPRLFLENGPAATAARAHRSHDALRYALAARSLTGAAPLAPPPAVPGTIRCAL